MNRVTSTIYNLALLLFELQNNPLTSYIPPQIGTGENKFFIPNFLMKGYNFECGKGVVNISAS